MTISEIAKLAGVSSAAVSRYFNNGYISEDKKEAIRKVVEETGYRPSLQAQTLRTKKTKLIGVILPRIDSSSMGRVVAGILAETEKNGYQILMADTQNNPQKEISYLDTFNDKRVDGVILVATIYTTALKKQLAKMNVPVVIVGQKFPGAYCVSHDDFSAEYDMTRLFLDNGCKELGFIGVTKNDRAVGEDRFNGYASAVREAGREDLIDNYVMSTFNMQSGFEKVQELLKKNPKIDGIICATDKIAIGALQYLKEAGIEVPGQIQIGGHGDSLYGRVIEPSITTIHYYYEESGVEAAKMMLEILDKGEPAIREIKLGYTIVEHASTMKK